MTSIDELRSRILTAEGLIAGGHSTQSLARAVKTGELVRLRPGYYAKGSARELDRGSRHLLSVLATDAAMRGPEFTLTGRPPWSTGCRIGDCRCARWRSPGTDMGIVPGSRGS